MTHETRPVTFVSFLERVLGVTPSDGQRVLWSVAVDGFDPADLEGQQRELARRIFGDVERVPPEARHTLAIVAGRRSGKTRLAMSFLLYRALTARLGQKVAPGEPVYGIVTCPDLRQSRAALDFVLSAAESVSPIRARIQGKTSTSITLRRDDGHPAVIEALPASRGGQATRGRSVYDAVLDEASFMRSEQTGLICDADIYRSLQPAVAPLGGRVVVQSSPWAPEGLLYSLEQGQWGKPSTALAARFSTSLARTDDPAVLAAVEREWQRDPVSAATEFDCAWAQSSSGFFDPLAIDQALEDYPLPHPKSGAVAVGVDAAFVNDASAFVAVGVERDGTMRVLDIDEIRPARGSPLKPSVVVERWAERAKQYGVRAVTGDSFYKESIREALQTHGLQLNEVPGGQSGKVSMFTETRTRLSEGRLRLPRHAEDLVQQLRQVQARPTPGGGLTIYSPRRGGSHGDSVSALVAAVHALRPSTGSARLKAAMDALSDPAHADRVLGNRRLPFP